MPSSKKACATNLTGRSGFSSAFWEEPFLTPKTILNSNRLFMVNGRIPGHDGLQAVLVPQALRFVS